MTRNLSRLLLTAALLGLGGSLASADPREAVLGGDGELYLIETGTYRSLFSEGTAASPDHTVLALDIVRSDKERQRLLVPSTQGPEVERSPYLVFEDSSDSLFLVWETQINVYPRLNLVSWTEGEWSEVIEVSGNPFTNKGTPRLTVTRDTYRTRDMDGKLVSRNRTVIHLAWWEETAGGIKVLYAPIVLLDGVYLGWNPVYVLNELDMGGVGFGGEVSQRLLETLAIQPGTDGGSVVVGFANPLTGSLVSLRVGVVPGDLSFLGDEIRAHIVVLGAKYLPDNPVALADAVRAHIVVLGLSLDPSITAYLADQARAYILDGGSKVAPAEIENFADEVRAHIVVLGARLLHGDVHETPSTAVAKSQVVEIENGPAGEGAPGGIPEPAHILEFRLVSRWPAPGTGDGPTSLYLSNSGRQALITWEGKEALHYRETRGSAWSRVHSLKLDETLDLTRAYQVLQQRVRSR